MFKKTYSLFFILTISLSSLAVMSTELKAAKKKIERFLPKSFKATFKQTYRSQLSGSLKSSTGRIDYQYPGHIRFETKNPDNIIFVSNKFQTWYYTAPFFKGEKGELSTQGASKNILTKFFDVLKNGLKSNHLYKVKKNKNRYTLTFTGNTRKKVGVRSARLLFKSNEIKFNNLKELSLTYLDKKKVRLTLSKLQTNYSFKKGYFFFKAPKNTKIIKR